MDEYTQVVWLIKELLIFVLMATGVMFVVEVILNKVYEKKK